MVLFLFIIMLLDLRAEERRKMNPLALRAAVAVALAFFAADLWFVVATASMPATAAFPCAASRRRIDDVPQRRHDSSSSTYNLPFQIIGVLILVATIGVIVLSQTRTAMSMSRSTITSLVSGLLFTIGFAGVLLRRNIIIIFMCLELMLNAANLSLVAFRASTSAPTACRTTTRRSSSSSSSPSPPPRSRSASRSSSRSIAPADDPCRRHQHA